MNYEILREVYMENKNMFDRDALRVLSPGKFQTITDVLEKEHFEASNYNDTHVVW